MTCGKLATGGYRTGGDDVEVWVPVEYEALD